MNANPETRAVLFDAAGTLLRIDPNVESVYARIAANHGVAIETHELQEAFNEAWRQLERSADADLATSEENERNWWHELVGRVLSLAGKKSAFGDSEAFFEDVWSAFEHPHAWEWYDDVIRCNRELRNRNIRMGIVSNWDIRLHRLMSRMGGNRLFDTVVTSADAGFRKPHPAPFQQALDRLDISPESALHVGDSYDEDIAGARAAGLRPILLQRNQLQQNTGGNVEVIGSLEELIDHV